MYKLIDSSSFFNEEEPQITILNPENIGDLVKSAADSRIHDFVKSIQTKPGMIYLHINAMGAGEFWSSNKNGDWFPEENLLQYYKTFETSPAHVFRHHINKDPAKSIGKVIYAIYNGRMHRVELISEVDKSLGPDIEERLTRGEYPSTSMACKTPFDVCSICGNKAHTRQEYCSHLRNELGKMYPDGRRVMALNVGPLKFFDISVVIRPADVTSGVLQKVAYVNTPFIGSAEMAEIEELGEISKKASHRKLADIIKEIEGSVTAFSPELDKIIFRTEDPYEHTISDLRIFGLSDVCHSLAELGISPSIEFLAELIARKYLGDDGRGLGKLIAQYVRSVDPTTTHVPTIDLGDSGHTNPLIIKLMAPSVERASLLPEYVEKRASNIGYASFNPQGFEPPVQHVEKPEENLSPISKALLLIGGTALVAKMFISKLIDEKLKERLAFSHQNQNGAKIVVIKQASDYSTASMLAKVATHKEVKVEDRKKELERLSKTTRIVLKSSDTKLGGKVAKILKSLEIGNKLKDKYKD
jgi:hypothetical protein